MFWLAHVEGTQPSLPPHWPGTPPPPHVCGGVHVPQRGDDVAAAVACRAAVDHLRRAGERRARAGGGAPHGARSAAAAAGLTGRARVAVRQSARRSRRSAGRRCPRYAAQVSGVHEPPRPERRTRPGVPPPPQVCPAGQLLQLAVRLPQPSLCGPHVPARVRRAGLRRAGSAVRRAAHVRRPAAAAGLPAGARAAVAVRLPQPSPAAPQVPGKSAHVFGRARRRRRPGTHEARSQIMYSRIRSCAS